MQLEIATHASIWRRELTIYNNNGWNRHLPSGGCPAQRVRTPSFALPHVWAEQLRLRRLNLMNPREATPLSLPSWGIQPCKFLVLSGSSYPWRGVNELGWLLQDVGRTQENHKDDSSLESKNFQMRIPWSIYIFWYRKWGLTHIKIMEARRDEDGPPVLIWKFWSQWSICFFMIKPEFLK